MSPIRASDTNMLEACNHGNDRSACRLSVILDALVPPGMTQAAPGFESRARADALVDLHQEMARPTNTMAMAHTTRVVVAKARPIFSKPLLSTGRSAARDLMLMLITSSIDQQTCVVARHGQLWLGPRPGAAFHLVAVG